MLTSGKELKITFIRPNMYSAKASDAMQPLAFAILSALTPTDIQTVLYDDRIEDIPYNESTDLVAMSVETFAAKRAYQIANEYRKRNIPVLMGGFHPSILPEECLQYADSIAIGDAEGLWAEIIADFRKGELKRIYKAEITAATVVTSFDRTIFKGKKYAPINLVQWGRGCFHNCDFCSIVSFYEGKQPLRAINEVIEEIKTLDNKPIFFVDDNIFHNKLQFTKFVEALIPLKKKWTCQISIDVAKDEALVTLMRRSGCIMVLVGVESLSAVNLQQMNKQWSSRVNYEAAFQVFRRNGIMIYATFVFGYDSETKESIQQTVDFAIKQRFFLTNFNPLHPLPKTELYNRLLAENRLLHPNWWLDDDYYFGKSIFIPKSMTTNELELECFKARQQINSLQSIFKRALDFKTNLRSFLNFGLYLLANLTNRREVFRKQGKKLG